MFRKEHIKLGEEVGEELTRLLSSLGVSGDASEVEAGGLLAITVLADVFVSVYLGKDFFVGILLHLDAEIDEDEDTDAADVGIDGAAEGKGVVDAVSQDWDEQSVGGCAG